MEVRELIERCTEHLEAAKNLYTEETPTDAVVELERMAVEIHNELEPPKMPENKTAQAQTQDGEASS